MKNYAYTNSQISALIAEHIHSKRDREILIDYFINGITYEKIAESHKLSVRRTAEIIRHGREKLIPMIH